MASKSEGKEGKEGNEILDDSDLPPADLKVILLGDSAVGKSKLVERFLMGDYHPRQLSTYGKTLAPHCLKQSPTVHNWGTWSCCM